MTIHLDFARSRALRAAALVAASAVVTAIVPAQTPAGASRWAAWVGCWQAVVQDDPAPPSTAFVCVRPAGAGAVVLAGIDSGRVISRDTIVANGERQPISAQGCTGWRRASWSGDDQRVFMHSEVSCDGGVARTSNALLGMSPGGDWIDVQSATAGGKSAVRTMRYAEAPDATGIPAEFAGLVPAVMNPARMVATAAVTPTDVLEAVRQTDTLVVQAWLIERGQAFELDARELISLANAGVPGSITDVMIGVSYPDHFRLSQSGAAPSPRPADDSTYRERNRSYVASGRVCMRTYDPYWYWPSDYYEPCGSRYGYAPYSRYGYGYGYGYGYDGYYGGYYGSYYPSPVIVVRRNEPPHGRIVKGVGYTDGSRGSTSTSSGGEVGSQSTSGRTAQPKSSDSGSSTSGSSGNSSSKSGGSSGTSTGRTAVKKGG